jgi:lipopolysaccharide transport system ATP-binding protein
MYQVEAICDRVIWLNDGEVKMEGDPAEVVAAYNAFLSRMSEQQSASAQRSAEQNAVARNIRAETIARTRMLNIEVSVEGMVGDVLGVVSGVSDITVVVRFASDPLLPCPSVAVRISDSNGRTVTSFGSFNDGIELARRPDGCGQVEVTLPRFPLLKGQYWVTVLLLSEDGIHVYESARMIAELKVEQAGLAQGVVSIPRHWRIGTTAANRSSSSTA